MINSLMHQAAALLADIFLNLSGEHYRQWKIGAVVITAEMAKPTSVIWKDGEAVPVDYSWEMGEKVAE